MIDVYQLNSNFCVDFFLSPKYSLLSAMYDAISSATFYKIS